MPPLENWYWYWAAAAAAGARLSANTDKRASAQERYYAANQDKATYAAGDIENDGKRAIFSHDDIIEALLVIIRYAAAAPRHAATLPGYWALWWCHIIAIGVVHIRHYS